jgi:hypothetical protein
MFGVDQQKRPTIFGDPVGRCLRAWRRCAGKLVVVAARATFGSLPARSNLAIFLSAPFDARQARGRASPRPTGLGVQF